SLSPRSLISVRWECSSGWRTRNPGSRCSRRDCAPSTNSPPASAIENDKEYQVLAELPGVMKEEISITINGNQVSVSAEVKRAKDVKNGGTVLRAERYFGKIQRAFALGQEIDEATAQAKYNDGVLELTLPKKTVAAAKKLAVH